jgi:hypothetical protein
MENKVSISGASPNMIGAKGEISGLLCSKMRPMQTTKNPNK